MFLSRNMVICALLAAMYLSPELSQSQARAGLFNLRSSKRKAAVDASLSSESHATAPVSRANRSAVKISLATFADDGDYPAASVPVFPPTLVPVSPPPSIPAYPAASVPVSPVASDPIEVVDSSAHCLNCGQDDHCRTYLRLARKQWKQTWYPRAAPYCQAGWGWNQPCWRRTDDTYNCPRPQKLTSPRRRVGIPEAPADEPSMEAPADEAMPDASPDDPVPEAPLQRRENAARR